MKSDKSILIAFLLNFGFAVVEFLGGSLTGSGAILADSLHDFGDALSIGLSYFLEKKSKRAPNGVYTYGYGRYSVLGGLLTSLILVAGGVSVTIQGIYRLFFPVAIHTGGMVGLALLGIMVNLSAVFFTRKAEGINQKAVHLHMWEDLLGWVCVLVGGGIMHLTGWFWLDSVLSLGVSLFVMVHALKNLKNALDCLLEKAPSGWNGEQVANCLEKIAGVTGVHHVHLWSVDGQTHCATLHVVLQEENSSVKKAVRKALTDMGFKHNTLQWEQMPCREIACACLEKQVDCSCHHHH